MKLQQQIKKEKKGGKGKLVGIQGMKMGEGDTQKRREWKRKKEGGKKEERLKYKVLRNDIL